MSSRSVGPRPKSPESHHGNSGREPGQISHSDLFNARPRTGTLLANYLDAIRYRQYCRSGLLERRRLLGRAALCCNHDWLLTAPIEDVVARVKAEFHIRSRTTLQKLGSVLDDYRGWYRAHQESGDAE